MSDIATTVDGLRAVELYFRVIREISSGVAAFFQSRTQLNTPGLGTLMPENFRVVAETTQQCCDLFMLELAQAVESCHIFDERELTFGWVSVYMPLRFLMDNSAERTLLEYCRKYDLPTGKLCFALSDGILFDSDDNTGKKIQALRNRGFHFMITDFGGEGCPIMRLAEFPVDYVMLSPEVSSYFGRSARAEEAVRSIVSFIEDMDAAPLADGVANSQQAEGLYSIGCNHCAGPLAGKYTARRYIRRKNDD